MNFYTEILENSESEILEKLERITEAEKIQKILYPGAEVIKNKQKSLIQTKSNKLADLIKINFREKKCYIGYDTAAIKSNPEALIFEFGRPGKRGKKNGSKMTQYYTLKNGKKVKVVKKIGAVSPIPHIYLGFETAKDEAIQKIIDEMDKELL